MREFELSDLIWLVGGIMAFVVMMFAYTYVPWSRIGHFIMSRFPTSGPAELSRDRYQVLGLGTDTGGPSGGVVPAAEDARKPDTNAANAGTDWEMPRISGTLSDRQVITLLAAQKTTGGKYRFSANDIYGLVKGPRAEVLAIVKALREPAPQYRPLTPEQAAARERLELDRAHVD